jgi:methionine-rich copper-binding protein CopC
MSASTRNAVVAPAAWTTNGRPRRKKELDREPRNRLSQRSFRRLASATAATLLAAALAPLLAVPAQAAVAGMSPVDPQNGFPTWFSDGTVKLQFCYMAGAGCLAEPPNPDAPASYPDNFPEEAFWFSADATGGNLSLYEAALEGAHLNGPVKPGEQMGFGRLRFDVNNLKPLTAYTITHPYGVETFVSDRDPKNANRGRIRETIDAGVCAPTATRPCDWAGVGEAFLGSDAGSTTSTFLKQNGAAPGTIGDINTARTVTGAPTGNNFVRVDGPDAGGPGVNTLTVSLFTVQGLIFDGADAAPSTPDLIAASDTGKSSGDNITNVTTPTLAGTVPGLGATQATVELVVDGAAAGTTTTVGGAYSLAPASALAQGAHRVQARTPNPAYSVDPATGTAVDPTVPQYLTSGTLTFTVDTVAPAVSIASPLPSNPSLDATPTLSFASEAGATYECQLLPSNAQWDPTCASPKAYDAQLDGKYTFNVRATDVAGNTSAAATYSWRIGPPDTTAPTLSAQSPAANATQFPLLNNVTATFSEAVSGVDATSFVLQGPGGVTVPAVVTYNVNSRVATLDPTGSLSSDTRYIVTLADSILDVADNTFAGSTWSFSTIDTVAPSVTAKSPAADATGVSATGNVTATLSEPVTGVDGTSFVLRDPAGAEVPATVGYDPTSRVATLNPTAALSSSTRYTASLAGTIADAAGNAFAGSSWSFTTADTVAPTVTATTPAANATGVSATGNVTATFSEPVSGVGADSFVLRDAAGATVPSTVSYDAATKVASLDPTAALASGSRYTVSLTAAIVDGAGNASAGSTWSFTTADTVAPSVTSTAPAGSATAVSEAGNVTATFSENVQGVSGTTFALKNAAGAAVAGTVTYNATTRVATLDPTAALVKDTRYTATLTGGATALRDAANNPLPTTSWTFTTGPAPTVTTRTPAANATAVSATGNITATFGEAVQGVSGTTFALKNAAGAAVAGTVTYNATTRVATLNPTATLAADAKYTATLTGGPTALRDAANNPMATTSWTFTTGPAPTITARTPASGATAVSRTGNVTATFSEKVTGVSGTTVVLKNATTGAVITSAVTYNATTRVVTLNPSATLAARTKFTIKVTGGATAVRDLGGNPLASSSWSFTTRA